jgi:hypothetical protein
VTGGVLRWSVAGLAALCLAGCAGGSAGPPPSPVSATATPPRLPPRPATLRLDGLDPCALLTPAQIGQLRVGPGRPQSDQTTPGAIGCAWSSFPTRPTNGWSANAIMDHGVEYYLHSTTGAQVSQVDGFAAVLTTSPFQEPARQCVAAVDVAAEQSLEVRYLNPDGDLPGMNHQVACQLARQVAELMVTNLSNRAH